MRPVLDCHQTKAQTAKICIWIQDLRGLDAKRGCSIGVVDHAELLGGSLIYVMNIAESGIPAGPAMLLTRFLSTLFHAPEVKIVQKSRTSHE